MGEHCGDNAVVEGSIPSPSTVSSETQQRRDKKGGDPSSSSTSGATCFAPGRPVPSTVSWACTGIDLVKLDSKSRSGRHTYLPTAITGDEVHAFREVGAFLAAGEIEGPAPSFAPVATSPAPAEALAFLS